MDSNVPSRDNSTKSRRSIKKECTVSIVHECEKHPVPRKSSWNDELPSSKAIKKKRFFTSRSPALILDNILHHKFSNSQEVALLEQPLLKDRYTGTKEDVEKGLSIPSLKVSLSDSDIITMPEEIPINLPPLSHHEFGHNKSTDHFTQQFAPLPTKHGSVKNKGEHEGGFFSPKRTFKMAHASFRNRIHREMYGLETVFMTKKRTRDTKSSSEFQGGDLNKYTSRTYAIQNGNEIFGG
uniref:Uncharacterized protein n=1 Tax=Parastrongyloides trichosuri TaxID=131310 RepID=A0A0N4ZTS1_PARTI